MKATRSYVPALVVAILGAVLLLFGIAASTDAGTVGGVALGAGILGAGIMQAFDVSRSSRGDLGTVSDRTVTYLQRHDDHSGEIRAPRSTDR